MIPFRETSPENFLVRGCLKSPNTTMFKSNFPMIRPAYCKPPLRHNYTPWINLYIAIYKFDQPNPKEEFKKSRFMTLE
jgi:hypothetical protein